MANEILQIKRTAGQLDCAKLKFLDVEQITMVDEALVALGDFGELRLVVEKGRLRFLVTQKSFDALKWSPGTIQLDKH